MNEIMGYTPPEAMLPKENLDFIINEKGKIYYDKEHFTPEFNALFGKYEQAALAEVRLRDVNSGNTREWRNADEARTEAHDAAARQLAADLERDGSLVTNWEARRIVNKLLEEKFPGADETDMLKRAFLIDRD